MEQSPALAKATVDVSPIRQFERWFAAASASGMSEQDATSMTLATADKEGRPCARIVLVKSFDDRGFVFYTNYNSRKGQELALNARACLLFYWSPLWRQVRIEGEVEKVSEADSDKYFDSRPLGSKLGAWASDQSQPVKSRKMLEKRFDDFGLKFADNVPRPSHWGGYRLKPDVIEFWQGRENRLHDRLRYTLQQDGKWIIERLAP